MEGLLQRAREVSAFFLPSHDLQRSGTMVEVLPGMVGQRKGWLSCLVGDEGGGSRVTLLTRV